MKKYLFFVNIMLFVSFTFPLAAHTSLTSGQLTSTANPWFAYGIDLGDGGGHYTTWSRSGSNIWFYGSGDDGTGNPVIPSNTDFFYYHNFTDPASISDATTFSYISSLPAAGYPSIWLNNTVFFRHSDGSYAAWVLKNLVGATLSVDWFFVDDGSGDFTQNSVPIPGAVWLLGSALIGLVGLRKRFKQG